MKHLIRDLRLRDGDAWLECECGHRSEADDPERLNDPYQEHRVALGLQRRGFSSSEYKPTDAIRWKANNTVNAHAEAQRLYRERHKEKLAESQREYRARKRGESAA